MTILFTDKEYRYENGRAPKGFGRWGFSFEGHEFWATGTLRDAKIECKREVKRLAPADYSGIVYVNILP